MSEKDAYVYVLCDFTYSSKEGSEIKIKKGEEFLLVQKSNKTWWQVIRENEKYPFYVPSCYLKIIDFCQSEPTERNKDVNANVELDDATDKKRDFMPENNENKRERKWSSFKSKISFNNHERELNSNGPEIGNYPNSTNQQDADHELNKSAKDNFSIDSDNMPIYANMPLATNLVPPNPAPEDTPQRSLPNNWYEYVDDNGRKYYHHIPSNKVTWKPPRRSDSINSFDDSSDKTSQSSIDVVPKPPPKQLKPKLQKLANSSSESLDSPSSPCMFTILPPGWTQEFDINGGPVYYYHGASKKRWYSSQDENGRTYFYDEDTSESFWELPVISLPVNQESKQGSFSPDIQDSASALKLEVGLASESPKMRSKRIPKLPVPRQFKVRSMVATDSISVSNSEEEKSSSPCSLGCTIHYGTLNKTKLVEGGRRVRKNWSSCYIVLTDVFLLFYKDARSASSSPNAKPEFSIDLNGALIDWCPDKSSKKNVLQISTITGYQLLLQHDDAKEMKDWFSFITEAIIKLPSSLENIGLKSDEKENKQEIKLSRSRSTKQCHCNKGSSEDVNDSIPAEKKKKIRDKLRHFFVRRPTMESLREKGIILDEPVFGCLLENLCNREGHPIPKFVVKCVETIERKELTADGIYRASGNLSQVQKIRFHVNQDDYRCLDAEEDVHVLTGSLKMFFREMKEPLFPFQMFSKFLHGINSPDIQSKLKSLKELVQKMPEPNYETLKFLLQHLLRVTEFHKQNRMQVQNLAIVFGPTLMWSEEESANIALDMMYQNRIVEFLLLEFDAVFN